MGALVSSSLAHSKPHFSAETADDVRENEKVSVEDAGKERGHGENPNRITTISVLLQQKKGGLPSCFREA